MTGDQFQSPGLGASGQNGWADDHDFYQDNVQPPVSKKLDENQRGIKKMTQNENREHVRGAPRWAASGLLTVAEAAAWLGLSAHTLNQGRSTGRGPRFVNIGRAIRYRLADLQAYASAPVRSTSERDAAKAAR